MARAASIIFLFLLPVFSVAQTQTQVFNISKFGGLMDYITPDLLDDSMSPDCLNVYTDYLGMVTTRTGYQKFNTTPLLGLQSIRNMFNYIQINGTQYKIAQSSNSVFANISGNTFTPIVQGLDSTAMDGYCIAKNTLYRDNGVNGYGGKWNGTTYTPLTVLNSTSPVSGNILAWWHVRLWKVGNGTTGTPSIVYFSNTNDPDNFAENYINVNQDDGDVITALIPWADTLIITKQFHTYALNETTAGQFVLSLIDNKVGCLYANTIDQYNGYPIWLSARGVELYNGTVFPLPISMPIDNQIRNLPQQTSSIGSYKFDLTQGQGTNIDSSTVAGSLLILQYENNRINQQSPIIHTKYFNLWSDTSNNLWQTFRSSYTLQLSTISILGYREVSTTSKLIVQLENSTRVLIASQTVDSNMVATGGQYIPVNFKNWNIYLTAESTYYITIMSTETNSGTGYHWYVGYNDLNNYDRGNMNAAFFGYDYDMIFNIYMFHRSLGPLYQNFGGYKSIIYNSPGVKNWVSLNISQTLPTGTSIQWFVSPATDTALCSSNSIFPVNPPTYSINMSSPVPYIMIIASMSTVNSNSPSIQSVVLFSNGSFGIAQKSPFGVVWNKRYYLFVTTDTATNINNVCYVYQQNQLWTKFNDTYIGAGLMQNNVLYGGSSSNLGQVWQLFPDGVYNDDGVAYTSYWKSKPFDFGNPYSEKSFTSMWPVLKNTGNWNITVDANVDNAYDYSFVQNVNTNTRVAQRTNFPFGLKGWQVQFGFTNTGIDQHFGLEGAGITYVTLPPR